MSSVMCRVEAAVVALSLLLALFLCLTPVVERHVGAEPAGLCGMTYSTPVFTDVTKKVNTSGHPDLTAAGYTLLSFNDASLPRRRGPATDVLLFVPGQAGGHTQGRTIGNMLQAIAPGFAVYAVDFKGEFSALDGRVLSRQARYVELCVAALARTHRGVASVDVLGHSMGALAALLREETAALPTRTLVALAAPLAAPPVLADVNMQGAVYGPLRERLLRRAARNARGETAFKLYTVSGGLRDHLVKRGACRPDLPADVFGAGFHEHRESDCLEGGVSCDHQAIVWCKEAAWIVANTFRVRADDLRAGSAQQRKQQAHFPAGFDTRLTLSQPYAPGLAASDAETEVRTFACAANEVFIVRLEAGGGGNQGAEVWIGLQGDADRQRKLTPPYARASFFVPAYADGVRLCELRVVKRAGADGPDALSPASFALQRPVAANVLSQVYEAAAVSVVLDVLVLLLFFLAVLQRPLHRLAAAGVLAAVAPSWCTVALAYGAARVLLLACGRVACPPVGQRWRSVIEACALLAAFALPGYRFACCVPAFLLLELARPRASLKHSDVFARAALVVMAGEGAVSLFVGEDPDFFAAFCVPILLSSFVTERCGVAAYKAQLAAPGPALLGVVAAVAAGAQRAVQTPGGAFVAALTANLVLSCLVLCFGRGQAGLRED